MQPLDLNGCDMWPGWSGYGNLGDFMELRHTFWDLDGDEPPVSGQVSD